MFTLIIWLTVIACVLLILIVLVQNPKGGGLATNFSAANQILGVNKTTEGVEKITWTLAGILLVLSLAGPFFVNKNGGSSKESLMKENIENATPGATAPAPAPQGTTPPPAPAQ